MYLEIGKTTLPHVLIVDDEPDVIQSLADLLRKDFHVKATTDAGEAIAALERGGLAMIVADQRMPGLTGAELLTRAAISSPDTIRILLTGYSDIEAVIKAVNEGHVSHYVTKPWRPQSLLELLQAAAKQHALTVENHRLVQQLAALSSRDAGPVPTGVPAEGDRLREENGSLKAAFDQLNDSFWHLRKIQEVLPICMECGKVKGEAASWEPVVDYLKQHALFLSHGYCPACEIAALAAIPT